METKSDDTGRLMPYANEAELEQLKAKLGEERLKQVERAMGNTVQMGKAELDAAKASPDAFQPLPQPEHIMQFFAFAHLKPEMQEVSAPFAALADCMVAKLPRNPERTVMLRKLLEAKDAAVRAFIAK